VRLLARREHAVHELRRKLIAKGFSEDAAKAAIERARAEGWQSDARYAEALARTRVEAGYGPLRIDQELSRQGIAPELRAAALAPFEGEWRARAEAVRRRRFGAAPPKDFRERARQARFLQYRGFAPGLVRAVVGDAAEAEGW